MMGLRPFICPFDRLLELVPDGASVLDVGCGCGLFLGLLSASGKQPRGFGVDVSAEAIPTAQTMARRLRETHVSTDLTFERIAPDDPWPKGFYDVVSLIDVIHHIPRPRQRTLFASAATAVRPGGLLLFKDIGPKPFWRACMNRLHDLLVAREWIHLVAADSVASWGRQDGLELIRRERINRLWYGHDLLLFRRSA
jgi:2-polyprenyl-3-methyl-5-hydroxy-6-metoxy-1,4-benzoquinol methylase